MRLVPILLFTPRLVFELVFVLDPIHRAESELELTVESELRHPPFRFGPAFAAESRNRLAKMDFLLLKSKLELEIGFTCVAWARMVVQV